MSLMGLKSRCRQDQFLLEAPGANLFLVPSSFCWQPTFLGCGCVRLTSASIKPPSALQRHLRWHSGPTQMMQDHLPHLTAKPFCHTQ